MMMCSEASTGSNCLIPVPKRLPIPAAMIRNAVFIVFSLCYLLFHCFNQLSFNIYRSFLFVFPLYKILMWSDPKRRFYLNSMERFLFYLFKSFLHSSIFCKYGDLAPTCCFTNCSYLSILDQQPRICFHVNLLIFFKQLIYMISKEM